MPATDNHFVTWSGAEHHLLQALVSNEVWQDTEGIHAHAGNSCSLWIPELSFLAVNIFQDNLVKFAGVS